MATTEQTIGRTGAATVVLVVAMVAFLVGRCTAPEGGAGEATGAATTTSTTWAPEDAPHLMLEEPDAFLDALRDRIDGPIVIRRIAFYPDNAWVEVQDPANERHLDSYSFRDGVLDAEPQPVAAGPLEDWEDELFTLETVKADVVRDLSRQALVEFGNLEHAQLTHLVVSRSYEGPPEIYVYVSDPIRGGGGYLVADTQGEVVDIN